MTVNHDSPLPLYYQLKKLFEEEIASGQLLPGDILPTEKRLQEKYNLSRTTVRKALSDLEQAGLVNRYRGRGTFVSKKKITHNPERLFKVTTYIKEQGFEPGWKIVNSDWVAAPKSVADQLKTEPGTQIFRLCRLRLADNEAIGFHTAYVSPDYSTAIDGTAFTEGGSLWYLRGKGYIENSFAIRSLEAVQATEEVAGLLGVEEKAPMLQIRRLVLSSTEQPIEYFIGVYRGDRFQYQIGGFDAGHRINA